MASTIQTPTATRLRKKRIPTACGACRLSKVKCCGGNPCTRCRSLKRVCNFTERPKDPYQEKLDTLNKAVSSLRKQFEAQPRRTSERGLGAPSNCPALATGCSEEPGGILESHDDGSSMQDVDDESLRRASAYTGFGDETGASNSGSLLRRGRRSHFQTSAGPLPDFVAAGFLTLEQAEGYFSTFFDGCDHYVPVFDPNFDTLPSIRQRSKLLFAAICTVGCRVVCGTDSHQWRLLDFHLKRMLSSAMSIPTIPCMETVQAFLVRACYSAERSLLVANATRLAIDADLPDAYDEMVARVVAKDQSSDTAALMRKARTWLHLLVLSHILHVDAGNLLTVRFIGDPRRARVLLDSSSATVMDRFLFAQVELNVLRANIFASLSEKVYDDEEDILALVRDAKIDIELWHTDWERALQQLPDVPQWIGVNLRVQRCWATTMALCRAVQTAGVENVDFMSPAQRSILSLAKESLRLHLQTIIAEPRSYLHNLRYAMDFVWAKCAFCYLLLLKLCILLPEDEGNLNDDLIACGTVLSHELSDAGGTGMSGISNSTAKMYLQLLQTGTEKFTRALQGQYEPQGSAASADQAHDTNDGYPKNANELDSFAPDQFIFEWDFPGLTLFSSSTTGLGWLDDILLGALNGGGDFFGFLAPPTERGDGDGQ